MTTETKKDLPFFVLLAMISFASINAVLFTPALPNIANYFLIETSVAQQTITIFLIGYALGQLLYGPLANRFGRKKALLLGVSLQILGSIIGIFSGTLHTYGLLVLGRLIMALGSSVGLKISFTMVNEFYEPQVASQKISYLMAAFAIGPGISTAIGGILNHYFGWVSCFYILAFYGVMLLSLIPLLPETKTELDHQALNLRYLTKMYGAQFKNAQLLIAALLMSGSTCFIYLFSSMAPFIAINLFKMSSSFYGISNIFPQFGILVGSFLSARLIKNYFSFNCVIRIGIVISALGVALMFFLSILKSNVYVSLFLPMLIINIGLSLIIANASTLAMSFSTDKAHGSSVMNFINIGAATLVVLVGDCFSVNLIVLPLLFFVLIFSMWLSSNMLTFYGKLEESCTRSSGL